MDHLNYVFFEEYKHLNKLCSELYKDQAGVTCYIEHMKRIPWSEYLSIPNWQTDLKELIRLRHIRNYLAHTEGAFEETICTQNDINWLQNFYNRILNQSDPIGMLYQISEAKKQTAQQSDRNNQINEPVESEEEDEPFSWIIAALVIVAIFTLIFGIAATLFGISQIM